MTTKRLTLSIFLMFSLICVGIAQATTHNITIKAASYDWHCYTHPPAKYNAAKKWPLVLVLHGAGGSGEAYLENHYPLGYSRDSAGGRFAGQMGGGHRVLHHA